MSSNTVYGTLRGLNNTPPATGPTASMLKSKGAVASDPLKSGRSNREQRDANKKASVSVGPKITVSLASSSSSSNSTSSSSNSSSTSSLAKGKIDMTTATTFIDSMVSPAISSARNKSSSLHPSSTPQSTSLQPSSTPNLLPSSILSTGNDIALATPTFSMPSPLYPPGISYLDLSSPLPESTRLPAPVIIANGEVRNLGKFTRNGKKRESTSSQLLSLGAEFQLPVSVTRFWTNKRRRTDVQDLNKKLKIPASKEAMLPNTPPLKPARAPEYDPDEDEDDEDEDEEEEKRKAGGNNVARSNNSHVPSSTNTASATASGSKQVSGNGSGSSCHQCKSRCLLSSLILCKNLPSLRGKGKRQGCRKKYCDRCLNKFYSENAPTSEQQASWACPACRGICRCAACRRQKAKHAAAAAPTSGATQTSSM